MSFVEELIARFKAQLAARILTAVTGAILTVALARLLGPVTYGLFALTLTVISVFVMTGRLGIGRSAGRYVAQYKESNPAQLEHIVRSSLLMNLATILIAALAMGLGHRSIARFFGEPGLTPYLILGVFLVVTGAGISFLEKVLQGFEDITFLAILEIFGGLSRLVLAIGLVIAGFDAIGALWGYLVSGILTGLIGFAYLYRRLRSFQKTADTIEPGLRRRIAEYSVPITLTNTAHTLNTKVDTLLVGYFLTPVEVGFYVIASQIVRFVETPMSALGFTLSPTYGAEKAAGNIDRVSRLYEQALVNTLLVYIPAGAGLVVVAGPLIELVFGGDYRGAVIVLQVLGIFVVLKAITKITDNGLDYLGRARERAIASGATSVLNVGLNIVFIPSLGVVGAAVATVITHGMYTFANILIAAQEFELRRAYLFRRLGLILMITGTMTMVVFVLSGRITGWVSLLAVVTIGVMIWAILSVVTRLLAVRKVVSLVT